MDNLTAGNPLAHRVRVYYEGSNTIYQGMLLNYNHDTTDNWFGGSVSNGEVTASNTTAEGSQNEGKFIRVEEPSEANKRFIAGVVCPGGWCGKSGPRVLDIYVPNGAIVPVRANASVVINERMYGVTGANTLVNIGARVTDVPCIGFFVETIDRSTAGLALAKLQQPVQDEVESASVLGVGLSPLLWADAPKSGAKDPGLGVDFFDDFMGPQDVTSADGWVITQSNSTGVLVAEVDAAGGVLGVSSAGALADDSVNVQLQNCCVKPAAGVNIWFEARIKVSEADEQWAIGLAGADTSLIAAGIFDDVTDKILFGHHTGTADKICTINSDGAIEDETADVADIVDDTWVTVGFKMTGITKIEYYVDGVVVETGVTANTMPNVGMSLSAFAGYEAAATILSVDWVKLVSDGGRDA